MAFNEQGIWSPEDDSVTTRLTGLLKTNSPLMKQARTSGLQAANRRGLLNSSMAVGASQKAMNSVALPVASQEASQTHQKNVASMDVGSRERIASMNVAAHDRERATAAASAMANIYSEGFRTVASQHELPADARNQYLQHFGRVNDSNMALIEQLYGIDLEWASPEL